MRRTPALIVGGGPAGAVAALTLARAGAGHLLIERQRETGDALCGGFLSWRTLEVLARLGVDPEGLTRRNVTKVTLIAGNRSITAPLPRAAKAVSRRRLDSILLDVAAWAGAAIERGIAARAVDDGIVRLDDGHELAPDALFLATGKHDLRGLARPPGARGADPALGLRVRLGPTPALDRLIGERIELHLFDRGYAGLVLQEDGTANCCMAVRRSRLTQAGTPETLLEQLADENPMLGERLAWRSGGAIDAVANVPYGWRAVRGAPGLFRLGDQAAVIPSLAGEGIGIAVASGVRAAQAHLRGGPDAAPGYQQALARDTARALRLAGLIRRIGESPRAAGAALRTARIAPGLIQVAAGLTRLGRMPKLTGECLHSKADDVMDHVTLSEAEWRKKLTPAQYHVLREAGTEPAFAGRYNDNKADGVYRCAGCGNDLFDSADKYNSGSGWPSFTRPVAPDRVTEHEDTSHGMTRTEARCARCDGHLGHVFPDGPPPAGLRYCINSLSLDFRGHGNGESAG